MLQQVPFNSIRTPCHILDMDRLEQNLNVVRILQRETGVKVLLTTKGFRLNDVIYPMLQYTMDGISISRYTEYQLLGSIPNQNCFVHLTLPVDSQQFRQLTGIATAIIPSQFSDVESVCKYCLDMHKYHGYKRAYPDSDYSLRNVIRNPGDAVVPSIGIRIDLSGTTRYGVTPEHLAIHMDSNRWKEEQEPYIHGAYFHQMSEEYPERLMKMIQDMIKQCDFYLRRCSWINLGGGQLLGSSNYSVDEAIEAIRVLQEKYPQAQIYMEPCEGLFTGVGSYHTTVKSVVQRKEESPMAIVDGSALCHMVDCPSFGWLHDIQGESDDSSGSAYQCHIYGCSSSHRDCFGTYRFKEPVLPGRVLVFQDTASYTMVKESKFDGIPAPRIYLKGSNQTYWQVITV